MDVAPNADEEIAPSLADDRPMVTSQMNTESETSTSSSSSSAAAVNGCDDNEVEIDDEFVCCDHVDIGIDDVTADVVDDVVDGSGGRLYSASEEAQHMDSADIIPEAAMKCGIIPLGSLLANDDVEDDYTTMCNHDNEFNFDGSSEALLDSVDHTSINISLSITSYPDDNDDDVVTQLHENPSAPSSSLIVASKADVDSKISTSFERVAHSSPSDVIKSVVTVTSGQSVAVETCAGCRRAITDRYLLRAVELNWHEACLRCSCCDCCLGEVGSTLFTRSNLLLCKRDYLRLFGATGYCSACSKVIQAFEMIMRAKNNVYHLECFGCQQCNQRFCMGDKFYLSDNKILCEFDYENVRAKRFASDHLNASSNHHHHHHHHHLNQTSSSSSLHHQHHQHQPHFSSSPMIHSSSSSLNPTISSCGSSGSSGLSTSAAISITSTRLMPQSTAALYRNGDNGGGGGHVNGHVTGGGPVVGNNNVYSLAVKPRQNTRIQHQQHYQQHLLTPQQIQHHQVMLQHQQQIGSSLVAAAGSSCSGTVLGCSNW